MSFATYSNLQQEIADYLARDDLAAKIPSFIVLAEAKFNRTLKCKDMEQRATVLVDIGSSEPEFISLPSDYQAMRRVRITSLTGKPRLDFLPSALLDEKRLALQDQPGRPCWYTVIANELELLPTPDEAYGLEMVYRKLIPALSDQNSSNWLLTTHPDAYLYGALLEAEPYMKNDGRIATWATALVSVMDAINSLGSDGAYNAGPLAIGLSKQQVI